MWPGMMPILHSSGRDDARAVRADQPRLGAGQRPLHLHHVEHRDAFGDADDQAIPASIASRIASAANGGGT